jgi:hypothetical protein
MNWDGFRETRSLCDSLHTFGIEETFYDVPIPETLRDSAYLISAYP